MQSQTPTQLLAEIRAATKLTEEALATRLGVSQPTVNRILRGQDCKSKALFAILRMHAEVMAEQAA